VTDIFRDPALVGLEEAENSLGSPLRVDRPGILSDRGDNRRRFSRNRTSEVLMVLPRPGGLLFHTKQFYPPGVLRLLSGGVNPGEPVREAAVREVREETGLRLSPARLLFHLVHHLEVGGKERCFHTLAFLFPRSEAPVAPQDAGEEITEFRALSWQEIPEAVRLLESLPPPWDAWGEFRALPHRLLLRLRDEHLDWFPPS